MQQIRNLILDMDGVLWLGMTPMPNLPEFFATLRELGINYALATNNASRTVDQYIEKFAKFGVPMEGWRILSSATTTGAYLQREYPDGGTVYVIGGDGLRHSMEASGFTLVNDPSLTIDLGNLPKSAEKYGTADIVVAGITSNVNYSDIALATHYINLGARFIGANPDASFPAEMGRLPGAGAIIGSIAIATGVEPTFIGKPHPYIYQEALIRLDASAENTAMVGDRLETDVLGADKLGLHSILVRSGINSDADLPNSPVQPTYIFDDINALAAALTEINS